MRTTGITQLCSINQTNTSADNTAIVYMDAVKTTGLTQNATQTAQIVQHADSGNNTACVSQTMRIETSTVAARGMPVLATLDGHQAITISEDSASGNNLVQSATSANNYSCSLDPLLQRQRIAQTATGSARITQNLNTADLGPNLLLDLTQNQGSPSGNTTVNSASFSQESTLIAVASTSATNGSVFQTQSTRNGGIQAIVNQFSHAKSIATANQTETECEHALVTGGQLICDTPHPPPYPFSQVQYGPVRKGGCCSSQGDNANDVFNVTQFSKLDNDLGGQSQQNVVQGDCPTTGTCNGNQTVKTQGNETDNSQTGTGNVQFSIECSSSTSCVKKNSFPSGHVLVSVGNGLVQEWDVSGVTPTLFRTLDTTKGAGVETAGLAFDSAGTLYSADFEANDVSHFNGDGTLFGSFGSGYDANPESILFDSSGNAYVGQADGAADVLKFSPSGALLASFDPVTEDRGTDWIDLASDQCTLYYTSESTSVKRFDVCSNTQLSDFATALPFTAFALKLLPDGGALVADTDSIVRLDSSGNVVQQYGSGESASGAWFSLALDPSGTSFWAGDVITGVVKKFDLSSGNELATFTTGGSPPDAAGGLAVAP